MRWLIVLLFCGSAHAGDGAWSVQGGKEHFIVSTALGFGCANVFQDSAMKAFGCAMVPGLIKEVIDSRQEGNKFSASDMGFNALGAALGVSGGRWMLTRSNGQTVVSYRTEF
jgi:putative lipoprotein